MRINRRAVRYLLVGTIVPTLVVGLTANASAAGNTKWRNAATGKYLNSYGNWVGPGDNAKHGWNETKQSDGTYTMKAYAQNACLDSNAKGEVYLRVCASGNNYQRWQQTKTSTGWKIKNKATGLVLDSSGLKVYTHKDNGGKNQRWN